MPPPYRHHFYSFSNYLGQQPPSPSLSRVFHTFVIHFPFRHILHSILGSPDLLNDYFYLHTLWVHSVLSSSMSFNKYMVNIMYPSLLCPTD